MITKIYTIEELKEILGEIFINETTKVNNISDQSVLNALFFAAAKVAQKALKDVALVESHIFPSTASGADLDRAAALFGVIARLGASKSSTLVRLIGTLGTVYTTGVQAFTSTSGIEFELLETVTIDANGFGYGKVRSVDIGEDSNIDPNTLINVSPAPAGHTAVTNEYIALGGRDAESDEDFRIRITGHFDTVAQKTIAYLTNILVTINSDILKLTRLGISDSTGNLVLGVTTQNGIDLTSGELIILRDGIAPYLALTDINKFGDNVSVEFENVPWTYINDPTGVDFRVELEGGVDVDEVRKNIQIAMSKYLDFKYWDYTKAVEWDDLLNIVKTTDGIKYVPDQFFYPQNDIAIPYNRLPRIRTFVMRDLDNAIISDVNGVITPVFYPNNL